MVRRLGRNVRVYPDLASAAADLAGHIARRARRSVRAHGRFSMVLSGGQTPRLLYREVARNYRRRLPWEAVELFFGDERAVSPGSAESNYALARRNLFRALPIPRRNIHRLRGEVRPLSEAATQYAREIGPLPREAARFDLVLLGLGPDGHTASLFPNSPALEERSKTVLAVRRAGEPPYVPRLTMTVPALSSGREVCFLVSGPEKAAAVASVLRARAVGDRRFPASLVHPTHGERIWFLDAEAARDLAPSPRSG